MKYEYPHTQAEIDENDWEQISEEDYWYFLEVLPPAHQQGLAFAVGEALTHMNDGRVVYRTCIELDGKFWSKPWPSDAFDLDAIVADIRRQTAK
jgi:hypothetical protein